MPNIYTKSLTRNQKLFIMRKLSLLLALFAIFAFIIVSCEEEEDETYEKSDLIGKWEQVSPEPQNDSSDCDAYKLYDEFTEAKYKSITSCDGMETSISIEYEFDGKTISYSMIDYKIKMEIKELTDSKLKYNMSMGGISETYEYTKVE